MTKIILIITFLLCGISAAYSQECLDKVAKQAVLIDSLQKVIKDANRQFNSLAAMTQTTQKALTDTIKSLKSSLASLEKFKEQKKSNDAQLETKNNLIASLRAQLSEKDTLIATTKQQGDQKARSENESGKKEALANLVNTYKKPFDDLIKSSSQESVQRDIKLVGNNTQVQQVLNELQIYFNAKELLAQKFDMAQLKNTQTQLKPSTPNSALRDRLKESISKYQTFNEGLKKVLNELVKLDKLESATGMGDEIQKLKFNKIMIELSAFIFDYDFNFKDYPYLSDIVLEIIKRKQPNADADITDLLVKL